MTRLWAWTRVCRLSIPDREGTGGPLKDTYLSFLPRDIWWYCILPYLGSDQLDQLQPDMFLPQPIWRQTLTLTDFPKFTNLEVNRQGNFCYGPRFQGTQIHCFNPLNGRNQLLYQSGPGEYCQIKGYRVRDDTLSFHAQRGNGVGPVIIENVSTAPRVLRINFFSEIPQTYYSPFELSYGPPENPIVFSLDKKRYSYTYQGQIFHQGQLDEIPSHSPMYRLLYYGSYLIIIFTDHTVQLYQII